MKTINKVYSFCKSLFFAAVGSAVAMSATAAPDAANVNNSSSDVITFILAILNGQTGYLLTLIAFVGGLFMYIQRQNFWAAMGCFALAIAIIVVPTALGGFFGVTTP